MSEPLSGLTVVLTVHLEPDDRVTTTDGTSPWLGVDLTITLLKEWRADHPDIRLNWIWRCDPAIASGFGDAGWGLRRWRDQILGAHDRGDEIGVHPHLWRWSDPLATFVSDAANDPWKRECVRMSADAFRRELGFPARLAVMGDGYMDPVILCALVDAGITIDLTPEPGAPARTRMVHTELVTGTMPDRRRTPRRPYRPSWTDPCRAARFRPAPVWMLPLTTASRPLVVDGVVVDDSGTAANLGTAPERLRHIVTTGLEASVAAGSPYVHAVVRSDIGRDPRLLAYTRQNLEWLRTGLRGGADRWGGTRFVTAPTALERLGCGG
jgi:hypothetical protein